MRVVEVGGQAGAGESLFVTNELGMLVPLTAQTTELVTYPAPEQAPTCPCGGIQ